MSYCIQGESGVWEVVVGLEVHCQILSRAKLFSGASTLFGGEVNSQVSFVDAGFPGMLPVINAHCVEQAVKTGLGLKAKINNRSVFARKNYFYADLPQGYQISQFDLPIVGEGTLILDMPDGSSRAVGIERLHLEQDAGKSMHDQHPSKTFIDLNRSGVALMEIVSRPDMRSPEEAGAYLRKLRAIVRYLETCDGNMEEGSMRCDVNVSVRRPGEGLRTRCEIKNVNSVRFVMQAIEYEAMRHVEVYESGGEIRQETRLFDPGRGETRAMRSKEQAHDYRYFPEPDLPPLVFDDTFVEHVRASMPELPDEKKQRFIGQYGITPYDATVLAMDRDSADYFEGVAKGRDGRQAAAWVTTNLFGALNKLGLSVVRSPVSSQHLGKLLDLIADETISGRLAKDVFEIMLAEGKDPAVIVEEHGMRQVTDMGAIEVACDAVITANPEKAAEVGNGKDKLIGWFMGQVMKETQGKANPSVVQDILKKKLLG